MKTNAPTNTFWAYKSNSITALLALLVILTVASVIPMILTGGIVLYILIFIALIVTTCVMFYRNLYYVTVDEAGLVCKNVFGREICSVKWNALRCAGTKAVSTFSGQTQYLYFSEGTMPRQFAARVNRNYIILTAQPGVLDCVKEHWNPRKVSYLLSDVCQEDLSLQSAVLFSSFRLNVISIVAAVVLVIFAIVSLVNMNALWLIGCAVAAAIAIPAQIVVFLRRKKN